MNLPPHLLWPGAINLSRLIDAWRQSEVRREGS
jgi:hypothetical protein